jgi:hypothetical protein
MLDPNVWRVEFRAAEWTPEVGDTCLDRNGGTWKILGYEAKHDRPYLIGMSVIGMSGVDPQVHTACHWVGRGALVGVGFCDAKCPRTFRVERLTPESEAFVVEARTIEGVIQGISDKRVLMWQHEAIWLGAELARVSLR